jgi:hypothetical protein
MSNPQKTQEHKLFIVRKLPKVYPLTDHQLQVKEVFEQCGIKKGMKRSELIKAMSECVPEKWREIKGASSESSPQP